MGEDLGRVCFGGGRGEFGERQSGSDLLLPVRRGGRGKGRSKEQWERVKGEGSRGGYYRAFRRLPSPGFAVRIDIGSSNTVLAC